MDKDLVFALAVIFVAVPVVFGCTAGIVGRILKYKERKLELMADRTAEKAAQYAAHVERLEARMRVLERIATDKGADLAAQIEDLRDPSVN